MGGRKGLVPLAWAAAVAILASNSIPVARTVPTPVPVQTPPPIGYSAPAATPAPMSAAEELQQAVDDINRQYGFDMTGWMEAAQSEPKYVLDKSLSLPDEQALMESYYRDYLKFTYFDSARTCVDRAAVYPDRQDFADDCNRLLSRMKRELPVGAALPAITIDLHDGTYRLGGETLPVSGGWDAITSGEMGPIGTKLHEEEAPVEAIIVQWTQESYVALAGRAPDVSLELEENRPRMLIISRKDVPEVFYHSILRSDLREADVRDIETKLDSLGYSAQVGAISGLELNPDLVVPDDITDVLDTAAHEGEHHWLDSTPLGKSYGMSEDDTTLNESAAVLVGGEVSAYAVAHFLEPGSDMMEYSQEQRKLGDALDLRMSETLKTVIGMRSSGATDRQISDYLEASRQGMNAEFGLAWREMSMARLGIYSRYSDNPLQDAMKELRGCVPGLADFESVIGSITSKGALDYAVQSYCGHGK